MTSHFQQIGLFRASSELENTKVSCATTTNNSTTIQIQKYTQPTTVHTKQVHSDSRTNKPAYAIKVSRAFPVNKPIETQINVNKQTTDLNTQQYDRCLITPILQCNGNVRPSQNSTHSSDYTSPNSNFNQGLNIFKQNKKYFKLLTFNAQGLLEGEHFDQIYHYNDNLQADLIAISETWLKKPINNKMIEISEYKIIRSDRNFKRANKKRAVVFVRILKIISKENA